MDVLVTECSNLLASFICNVQ